MSTRPGQTTVPFGPLIAAIGAGLLLVSLFLDWYEGLTAFTVFELVDIVLVVCALFVVLVQLVNDPPAVAGGDGPDREIGIWLAAGGAVLMATGALLATANISLAIEPRRPDEAPGSPVDHGAETVADPSRPAPKRSDEPPATP